MLGVTFQNLFEKTNGPQEYKYVHTYDNVLVESICTYEPTAEPGYTPANPASGYPTKRERVKA